MNENSLLILSSFNIPTIKRKVKKISQNIGTFYGWFLVDITLNVVLSCFLCEFDEQEMVCH